MDPLATQQVWERLVENLIEKGVLYTPRVIDAFRCTPRSSFVPAGMEDKAVSFDQALPIGEGQTISQPTTVAIMLEAVALEEGDSVLDIGTGSGWQAALLARCVGDRGHVYTIERLRRLADTAREHLTRANIGNVTLLVGDASHGLAQRAPFDVIIAAAEASDIPPLLIKQLAPSGRLLQPVSGMGLRVARKMEDGTITTSDIPGFVFVPLVESGEEPKKLA